MNIAWIIVGITFILQGVSAFTPVSAVLLGILWIISGALVLVNAFYPINVNIRRTNV